MNNLLTFRCGMWVRNTTRRNTAVHGGDPPERLQSRGMWDGGFIQLRNLRRENRGRDGSGGGAGPDNGEAETNDREGILLPGRQQELVSKVAAAASGGPVVLILMSGGPIDVYFAKNDPRISAILWVGYPGQAGGAAIADALFGTTNPGMEQSFTFCGVEC